MNNNESIEILHKIKIEKNRQKGTDHTAFLGVQNIVSYIM